MAAAKKKRRAPAREAQTPPPPREPKGVVREPSGVYVRVPVAPEILDAFAEGRELAGRVAEFLDRMAEVVAAARRGRR